MAQRRYLDLTGLTNLVTNIRAWVASIVPTKTSELNNDANFITSSDLPTNHVTTNTTQTISSQKTFSANQFFTSGVYQRRGTYTLGNTVTDNQVTTYNFVDSVNAATGYCRSIIYKTSNMTSTEIAARNKIKNGALDTTGDVVTAQFFVRVESNGTKYIAWEGSVKNNIIPYATNTYNLGSSTAQWSNTYTNKLYLNGTEFKISDIPTKTSDLTNDSNFVTSNDVSSAINNVVIAEVNPGYFTVTQNRLDNAHATSAFAISPTLCLPSVGVATAYDIDTTNWDVAGGDIHVVVQDANSKTVPGYVMIYLSKCAATDYVIIQLTSMARSAGIYVPTIKSGSNYYIKACFPTSGDFYVNIVKTAGTIGYAKLYPFLGNFGFAAPS